jgi:hypothetical protein
VAREDTSAAGLKEGGTLSGDHSQTDLASKGSRWAHAVIVGSTRTLPIPAQGTGSLQACVNLSRSAIPMPLS